MSTPWAPRRQRAQSREPRLESRPPGLDPQLCPDLNMTLAVALHFPEHLCGMRSAVVT